MPNSKELNILFLRSTFLLLLLLTGLKSNAQEKILRFDHVTVDEGLPQNTVQGIVKDKYGFMWFGTWEGLCRFDGYNFDIYRTDRNNPKTIYNNRIHMLYKDNKGDIWVSGADTLISKYNYETDDFTRYRKNELPHWLLDSLDRYKNISFTSVKNKNYVWTVHQQHNMLTRKLQFSDITNLLEQTNLNTQKTIFYRTDPINPWTLLDEYVFQIYLDDMEVFWAGTYSGGINKADLKQKPFNYYYKKIDTSNTLINNLTRAFCEDHQGNLWVGTHNKGITKINRTTDTYTFYTFDKNNPLHSISDNLIRKIYCDKNGFVWIGTKNGLDKYNPATNTFKHYKFPPVKGKPRDWVYSIMEDSNNNLWIGTWTGIAKYNSKKDSFHIIDPAGLFPSHFIRVIAEDKNRNLWVATEGGLSRLKRNNPDAEIETFTPTIFKNNPDNENTLVENRIYTMLIDDEGIIWLGTAKGLNRFDPVANKFTHYGQNEGFPDEFIVGILNDNQQNLWISHKKGISKFNKLDHSIINYSKLDGLQSNDFSEDAYYKSPKTGEMFFGGAKGFNSFFPEQITNNPYPPVIRLTKLKINNSEVHLGDTVNKSIILHKPLYLTNQITLGAKDKVLAIEFTALHFAVPKKNQYKYMLEGFDKTWISTNASNRIAIYTNLKAGKYTFKVIASNSDGIWNTNPAMLLITIKPPYWKTWWFISLATLGLLILLYFLNNLRISSYIKIQNTLSEQVEQRTRLLKETNELLQEKQLFIQNQSDKIKETNNQLSVLNSTKDRLFSIVAHDLRNPFNVVGGFAELLINKLDNLPKEKILKYLNLIHISAKSANNLLENLLDWSRMQTGRISFEPSTIQIFNIANDALHILEADIHRKNITITNNIDPDIYVYADTNMLKTIFRNLVSNAIKFSNENSEIILKSEIADNSIKISVTDFGIGMTPDIIDMLFRIDASISHKGTTNESGTGLGLIICKEFIDKHNGAIHVESNPDKGSTFIFTLPLA